MLETRTIADQATRLREIAYGRLALPTPAQPRIVTITSGKGGVGKSTLALNLSIAMCMRGEKVVLVDADANLGSLDLMLGIAPEVRLGHVLRGDRDIEDAMVSPLAGLRLLPGSSGDIEYPAGDHEARRSLLADLRQLEDRPGLIIIDTAAGLTPEIISFAGEADETIVVTSPEPTAVIDAYAMIKVIHTAIPDMPVSVVMNAVRVLSEADDAVGKLAVAVNRFLGFSFSYRGAVPFDQNVARAIARQRPVLQEFPASGASLSLNAMAEQLFGRSL